MPHALEHPQQIHALLHEFRAMADRHKTSLDALLDADGDITIGCEADYRTRDHDIAREAHTWLHKAMATLTDCIPLPDGQQVTVLGQHQVPFTLTTGRLDDAARTVFRHGQCHALARALTHATGWPMAVLVNDECHLDPDSCTTFEVTDGVCGCQLEHVIVIRPEDGAHIDITGAHAPGTLPDYEDQRAIVVDDTLWAFITRSPAWRRPALDVAQTFIRPLLASLPHPADFLAAAGTP
ncbi:hypothetical protein ACH4PU_31115 [Streptomyces sp. NPDC021100]|uniref:hypothetical protein n=1 Tax=Streptomyces sp. NPDC021100 TaxID=3365114 RepID=UPI00379E0706